ncbi:ankyrin [Colletotrichum falcatum]|nr:ankyrin [Colletotrichum falcatum]
MLAESPEVLELLLGRGARTTDTDEEGRNVWHFAAANSDVDMIDALRERDEHRDRNLRGQMTNLHTPIAQSVSYPLQQMMRDPGSGPRDPVGALRMLEVCERDVAYLQNPRLLVSLAAFWGSGELVRGLVDFGADPLEADDAGGGNALHRLGRGATESLVQTLLDLGVEPVLTAEGLSPAETIFSLSNNPELSVGHPDRPFDDPLYYRPVDFAAYDRLLTDDVLSSRNGDGAGLWERFAAVVLGQWASRWPWGASSWISSLQNAVRCLIRKGALAKYEEEKGECGIVPVLSGWAKTAPKMFGSPKCLSDIMGTILRASTRAAGFGESPAAVQCLKLAVELENADLVAQLLDLGVLALAPHEGISALESACMPYATCPMDIFSQLLDRSDGSRLRDVGGSAGGLLSRFLDTAVCHSEQKVASLLSRGRFDLDAKSPGGVPLLVDYVLRRRTGAALALLGQGADPAASSSETGVDAALAAAATGDMRVLHAINEDAGHGVDWEKTCTRDFTAMDGPGSTRKKGCNALHLAAAGGFPEVIRFYLEVSGLDVESPTADGWRPIHFAAAAAVASEDCIRVLVDHGADPTTVLPSEEEGRWDPLSLAARKGRGAVKALLGLGPETVKRMNVPGAFAEAFRNGDRGLMEPFRPFLHELVETPGGGGKGAASVIGAVLEFFIETGETELAARALKMADPESVDSIRMSCGECSPLVHAAARGRFELGRVFLDHGMTTWNRVNRCVRHPVVAPSLDHPCTALHMALMLPGHSPTQDPKGFVTSLLGAADWSGHELSPFHCAAIGNVPGRVHMIADWIRASPQHHARLLRGMRAWPSSAADGVAEAHSRASVHDGSDASGGPEPAADAILKHYVNRHVASPDLLPAFRAGQTPLLVAVDSLKRGSAGGTETMEALLRHGADANLPGRHSCGTPLDVAARADRLNAARLLLAHGADPNLWAPGSSAPLITAVAEGHLAMAQLLVEHGADINVRSADGAGLLGVCGGGRGGPDMFVWLVGLGLDPYGPGPQGRTPIHDAVLRGGFPGLVFNYGFDFSRLRDVPEGFLSLVVELGGAAANGVLKRLLRRLPREKAARLANATPEGSVSPLCNAVVRGALDCIPTLLRHGASVDGEGSAEGSALMAACARGDLEAAKALLRHGASVSYESTAGGAPVSRSAVVHARGFPRVLRWLLVDRHARLRGIGSGSEGAAEAATRPWSGGRVAGYELSGVGINTGRRAGETGLEYLRRLDRIRRRLRGQVVQVVDLGGAGQAPEEWNALEV